MYHQMARKYIYEERPNVSFDTDYSIEAQRRYSVAIHYKFCELSRYQFEQSLRKQYDHYLFYYNHRFPNNFVKYAAPDHIPHYITSKTEYITADAVLQKLDAIKRAIRHSDEPYQNMLRHYDELSLTTGDLREWPYFFIIDDTRVNFKELNNTCKRICGSTRGDAWMVKPAYCLARARIPSGSGDPNYTLQSRIEFSPDFLIYGFKESSNAVLIKLTYV